MAELSADTLLGGRVRFSQPVEGYRTAIDPVLLAAAAGARRAERVLDAGCGTGAAMLCLLAREPQCSVVGVDASIEATEIARRNLLANGFDGRSSVVTADLAELVQAERGRGFDLVITNPPFLPAGAGTPSPRAPRRGAHVESMTLRAWIGSCLDALLPGGWLLAIHRADRLDELCAALAGSAGDVGIMPLWPKADAQVARRVLVRARKGSRGPAVLARGLVLHEADGGYTAAAEAVLRHGAALEWPR